MYAIYHGREGLREIANRVHRSTLVLAETLRRQGHIVHQGPFFDSIKVSVSVWAWMCMRERERESCVTVCVIVVYIICMCMSMRERDRQIG
jgi:glycine cleavage system pyridoxal-binding protein P